MTTGESIRCGPLGGLEIDSGRAVASPARRMFEETSLECCSAEHNPGTDAELAIELEFVIGVADGAACRRDGGRLSPGVLIRLDLYASGFRAGYFERAGVVVAMRPRSAPARAIPLTTAPDRTPRRHVDHALDVLPSVGQDGHCTEGGLQCESTTTGRARPVHGSSG